VRTKLVVLAATLVAVLSALWVPAASADQIVTPSPYDFGALPIGATSATVPLTLTAKFDTANMCAPQPYMTTIASSNPAFTVVSEDCPDLMPATDMTGTSCTIMVRFSPVAVGNTGAAISTGMFIPIPPGPPKTGTPGELFGYGICSTCFPGYFPGPNTQPVNSPLADTSGTSTKKKCKKAKSASTAKRCKKKRK
jgi:hypothetical protein